jgi:hypothetical protein
VTERESLRKIQKFPSDIMAWQGVARVLRMNASEPMVGWKGKHPQSFGR